MVEDTSHLWFKIRFDRVPATRSEQQGLNDPLRRPCDRLDVPAQP